MQFRKQRHRPGGLSQLISALLDNFAVLTLSQEHSNDLSSGILTVFYVSGFVLSPGHWYLLVKQWMYIWLFIFIDEIPPAELFLHWDDCEARCYSMPVEGMTHSAGGWPGDSLLHSDTTVTQNFGLHGTCHAPWQPQHEGCLCWCFSWDCPTKKFSFSQNEFRIPQTCPCFCLGVYHILVLIFIALEYISYAGNLLFRKDGSCYLEDTDCG